MKKVSDAIREIVFNSPFLRFGFQYELLNLTQLAKFIQPLVEARIKKEVTPGAIVMSLSRLGREGEKTKKSKKDEFFKIDNLVVHSDLIIVTVYKTAANHREVNNLYRKVQKAGGIMTVTEGLTEITIIFQSRFASAAQEILQEEAKRIEKNISSLSVKFDDTYLDTPGFLYAVLRQIAMQGINIIELSSTATEFILYLADKDIQLAFDTLYGTFSTRQRHGLIPG
jgi:hypothetical protein